MQGRTAAKLLLLFGLAASLLVLAAGCWDAREIEDLAMVQMVGFDKVTLEGEPRYRVTFTIVRPSQVAGQGAATAGVKEPSWLVSGFGVTIADAAHNLSTRMPRETFEGQAFTLAIGERLAREDGLTPVMEFIQRAGNYRLRTRVIITPEEAQKSMATDPEFELSLAQEIDNLISFSRRRVSKAFVADFLQTIRALSRPGMDPITGRVELFNPQEGKFDLEQGPLDTQETAVRLTGAAVFRGDRLADYLTEEETQGYLLGAGKQGRMVLPLIHPTQENRETVTVEVTGFSASPQAQIVDGQPVVKIQIDAESILREETVRQGVNQNTLLNFQNMTEKRIQQSVQAAVQRSRELQSDFFGFGDLFRQQQPQAWKEMAPQWELYLSGLQVEVEVKARIRRVGAVVEVPGEIPKE